MSKKQIVLWSVLTGLAVALVLVALLVPVVQIVVPEDSFSAQLSLLEYMKVAPFVNYAYPAAETLYFGSDGPIWLATGGILFNILLLFGGFALLCACVFELAGMKLTNASVKKNVLAKKLAYFVGWFAVAIGIFQIVSYSVTTIMARGYMIFLFDFGCIALVALGIAIVALARRTDKRASEQQPNKLKNALGFAIAGVFALLVGASLFMPIFNEWYFSPEYVSIYGSSSLATIIAGDPYILSTMGDYPFGFCTWACYALIVPCLFVFVYSLIGFIFTLKGKPSNWLSARVKRWSMAVLVWQMIVFMFVLCQIAVLWTNIVADDYCMLKWTAIVVALLPFVPYVASTLVSVEKKQKEAPAEAVAEEQPQQPAEEPALEEQPKKEEKPATKRGRKPAKAKENAEGWLEPNQIPNDVTEPLEKDVTKNLVDEPRPTQTDNE